MYANYVKNKPWVDSTHLQQLQLKNLVRTLVRLRCRLGILGITFFTLAGVQNTHTWKQEASLFKIS